MSEQTKTTRPAHVLVVDDNVELADTYRQLLEVFDYRVTTMVDGAAALKFILGTEVDVVLCDLSMPGLEGDEFYEAARRARPELTRRFIFVTGHVNNPKYEPFLKNGDLRVLYKPVFVNNLMDTLKAALGEPAKK